MLAVWRQTFPTLNWDDIRFYDGIPGAYSVSGRRGLTTGSIFGLIRIYLKSGIYNPCDVAATNPRDMGATFRILTHELVHAVQIKSQVLPQVFLWKWLTCYLSHGIFDYYDSCYEKEARDFANLITNNRTWNPCTCSHFDSPFENKGWFGPELNLDSMTGYPAIVTAIGGDTSGGHRKTTSFCSLGDCFGDNIFSYAKGLIAFVVGTVAAAAGTFFMEGPVAAVTTIIGAAGGLIGGLALGLGYGGLVSGGVVSAIVGAVLGLIVGAFVLGLLGAFADWIIGVLSGPIAGGSLNIVHSTDKGATFRGKVTFERTREQPALAASESRLFLAWTGTDGQLNVFVSPDRTKTTLGRTGPCGPALSYHAGLYIGWKGEGNDHPNCMSSVNGVNFGSWSMSQGNGPSQATPGIAMGPARIYMAWVGHDNHIRLINLVPGNPITEKPIAMHRLPFRTGHQQTPALAFGDSTLFLAWSTMWTPHYLQIARFPLNLDGSINFDGMSQDATNDFTTDKTGPALAFGSKHRRLYLAFTGADNGVWVLGSPNGGWGWDTRCRLPNELSRDDAGPSITVHPSTGTVFLCWVGQDGD